MNDDQLYKHFTFLTMTSHKPHIFFTRWPIFWPHEPKWPHVPKIQGQRSPTVIWLLATYSTKTISVRYLEIYIYAAWYY